MSATLYRLDTSGAALRFASPTVSIQLDVSQANAAVRLVSAPVGSLRYLQTLEVFRLTRGFAGS
jgi:hypothetical protein